ncbi:membrane-associated zinc metalloprotease [Halorhodospira halochloris]|uniref:Zinc metalloprotease n=1 Tax=Halorhodospira halochloris TaxID=1052 RepID=A0A0X8X8E0_HALHR|nr:RIP metalloprotease RseP [Halorhodospira halochloris]MBK1651184.1 RIP metalloprotease RseP [Halorhodospira halochloris]BAU57456.2 membrane-associated zinc metalloprotease [Halorhodospira halochloris]
MTLIWSILAFLVAITILVGIHEAGHFLVARRLGVKVRRFSIGFGRPLLRWQGRAPDHTEYVLAMIPLGGYVQMLEGREPGLSEEDKARSLNSRPVGQRAAVVIAGPAANFLFAILVYWAVAVIGDEEHRPIIDQPPENTVAYEAGLERGHEIISIDGRETPTWQSAVMTLLDVGFRHEALPVVAKSEEGREQEYYLNLAAEQELRDTVDILGTIGLYAYMPILDPQLGHVQEDGPAGKAGMSAGDKIIKVADQPVETWRELTERLEGLAGEEVEIVFEREGVEQSSLVTLGKMERGGREVGRLGVGPQIPESYRERMVREVQYGPVEGFFVGVERTWDTTKLTAKMLGRMIIGEASLQNIGGPVTIGEFAGESAAIGITAFLFFLGLISVTLGIVNLLPIPILDGGHLMYLGYEAVTGRAVSDYAMAIGQRIGILAIIAIMTLALYNDFTRIFG